MAIIHGYHSGDHSGDHLGIIMAYNYLSALIPNTPLQLSIGYLRKRDA
jgi:hypothetical protein